MLIAISIPLAAFGVLGDTAHATIAASEVTPILTQEEIEWRGHRLREALTQSLRWPTNAVGREIVLQNIPVGTAFQDARAILENAGFEISSNRLSPKHSIVNAAAMLSQTWLSRAEAIVNLFPQGTGVLVSGVGDVRVTFYISTF